MNLKLYGFFTFINICVSACCLILFFFILQLSWETRIESLKTAEAVRLINERLEMQYDKREVKFLYKTFNVKYEE